MWYRPYGKTGKQVSVIGFGGMRFADPGNPEAMAQVVLHAYRRGINYFDTAPYYCNDKSEEIMGLAFGQMKPGTFYSSSKCMESDGAKFRASLERSLTRLGLERLTFFHIWCLTRPQQWGQRKAGGAVAAAIQAKQEGLIEHVVVSSHLPSDALCRVLDEGIFEGVTLGYCAINFPYRQAAVDAAARAGLGVVTMNPLGGGLIPDNAERFDFLKAPGDPSVVAAALRFNVSQPSITSALVGFANTRQVDDAVEAVENFQPYPPEHIETLRQRVLADFDGLCTGCGYCLPCPVGIEIPQMMDAYNLKILSEGKAQAITDRLKWHWQLGPEAAQVCTLCGACEKRCTQRLPIRERLKEIASLAEKK